jgi:hypothetical protein
MQFESAYGNAARSSMPHLPSRIFMALDRNKDYGISCGGPTNGFAVQDGKIYNHDGAEVDKNGVPVKPASAAHQAAVAKKEPATPELSEQIRASTPSRNDKARPRTDWAKEYQRLNHYPYPPEFYAFTCRARTRAGTPCKLRPDYANGRCKFHGGASTGPNTEQGRLQSAVNGRKGGRPRKRVVGQDAKT